MAMGSKKEWWEGIPRESYWCEITDRSDIGENLHAPQQDQNGKDYWSYSLVKSVKPGDIVFHYSTSSAAFVGASVAAGPLQESTTPASFSMNLHVVQQ